MPVPRSSNTARCAAVSAAHTYNIRARQLSMLLWSGASPLDRTHQPGWHSWQSPSYPVRPAGQSKQLPLPAIEVNPSTQVLQRQPAPQLAHRCSWNSPSRVQLKA